jgi:hypothetical protein
MTITWRVQPKGTAEHERKCREHGLRLLSDVESEQRALVLADQLAELLLSGATIGEGCQLLTVRRPARKVRR